VGPTCWVTRVDDDKAPGLALGSRCPYRPLQFLDVQTPGVRLIQVIANLDRNAFRATVYEAVKDGSK